MTIALSLVPAIHARESTIGGGGACVLALAHLCGQSITEEVRSRLVKEYPESSTGLTSVKNMAASIGIDVVSVKAQMSDLLEAQRPAIVHLNNPDECLLLVDGSQGWLRILEGAGPGVRVVPRWQVEPRFDGYALILKDDTKKDAPRIRFEDTDYQFAIAGVGQKAEHEFRFSNVGKSDLVVSASYSTCRCTASLQIKGASEKEVTLRPGEGAAVQMSHHVGASAATQDTARVNTNDPYRPTVYLTLRGTVPQDMKVSPESLSFEVEKACGNVGHVDVIALPSVTIVEASVDDSGLNVTREAPQTGETKKAWRIQVCLAEQAPVGELKATLTIKTTHPDRPLITVPITGVVRGDLQISPSSAFFGFVRKGEKKRLGVVVESRSKTPFHVTAATLGQLPVRLEGESKEALARHELRVLLEPKQAGLIEGQLQVKTDVSGEETLVIPVWAFVEDG